jgi:P4 family phage/plasmid primase-like protien
MKLSPHSPQIYSTVQIPCNWTDKPCDTPYWDKFIETLTVRNLGYSKLLHEFAGAVISNVYGYRFKKALFLVGSGDTGKSVLMSWLSKILGTGNSVERSLTRIGQRFGETAAYMTRLIYSSDMSDVNADNLDRFKELTGGDSISIEYKNKEPFGYRFNGFMGFSMNKLPKFGGDKGDHVYERMLIIKCDNVIPECERDHHLPEQLYADREGIIHKCIQHFREVINNGYKFTIPPECIKTLNEYKTDNSAVLEFWDECTEDRFRGDSEKYTVTEVYNAFRNWNEEQGNRHKPAMQEFKREVGNFHHTDFSKIIKRNSAGNIIVNRKLNGLGKKYLPPQRQGFY